jgi:hypothetical protein
MRMVGLLRITFRVVVLRREMSSFFTQLPCASFLWNARGGGYHVLWGG